MRSSNTNFLEKKQDTITVRGLVSRVIHFHNEKPSFVGISTSYPTPTKVQPRPVHSHRCGSDLVLCTFNFRVILAASLPFFILPTGHLHNQGDHRWERSSASGADTSQVTVQNTAALLNSHKHSAMLS